MKTYPIKLEILREGPAYNQLLSPLTRYLAVCGNHEPEPFRVAFEHAEFQRLVEGLADPGRRGESLRALSTRIGEMMGGLRGLLADVSAVPAGDQAIIQLRLVITAAELALVPFELMIAPRGYPGQGQHLSLQTEVPVVVTREAHRLHPETLSWPHQPRILVAFASPTDDVPREGHLWAIASALAPRLWREDRDGVGRFVEVLERATLAQIQAACAKTAFTHVHILAHGARVRDTLGSETKYGVALHASDDDHTADVVSGERLGVALRCRSDHRAREGSSRPVVVTLATCNGGDGGSVITPGASVAHALHQAGVPLVIASQFPLSKRASVTMTEVLYRRLLRGEDPRAVVADIRQTLFVTAPDTCDWGGVTVYAALPENVHERVRAARFRAALAMVEGAMARLEQATLKEGTDVAPYRERLRVEMEALEDLPRGGSAADRRLVHGMLASARKREAQAYARGDEAVWRRILRASLGHYECAFALNGSETWALVQALVLGAVLDPGAARTEASRDRWVTAVTLSKQGVAGEDAKNAVWSHSALVELYTLAPLVCEAPPPDGEALALSHLHAVLRHAERGIDRYALRKQLDRYSAWWWPGSPVGARAEALAKVLAEHDVPDALDQHDFE